MMKQQLSGPAFPFTSSIEGVIGVKTRKESLLTSLHLILTTPKGSIVYDPNLGSHVPMLVFEPIDGTTINLLTYYIINDVETQDSRIKIKFVNIVDTRAHRILIWVGYQDRNDDQQKLEQTAIEFGRG